MPGLKLERELYHSGSQIIAGIDEAGRGPLAGPVVAAAVILPRKLCETTPWLNHIDDSKKLSQCKRNKLVPLIKENSIAWSLGQASAREIDRIGIREATEKAMVRALEKFSSPPNIQPESVDLRENKDPIVENSG